MDDRVTWLAPTHEHREHDSDWYWVVGILTVSFAVVFIILDNTLLSVILLLGMGLLLAFSRHDPEIVEYELSKKGVRDRATLYPWETLESFWILDAVPERGAKILLTSKKVFMPHIVIPLDERREEEVRNVLSQMLHEEPQVEPLANRLIRRVGF